MISAELCKLLGVSPTQLAAWIDAGMPHKQIDGESIFNADQVVAWLLETGRATRDEPGQTIVRTIPEVANYFGVSTKSVANWLKDPLFPGKAGERGRQNGRFPLEAIAAWRDARDGSTSDEVGSTARERKWAADAEIRELELARMRGELIEVDVAAGEMERAIHNAKAILTDVADIVADSVPSELPEGGLPALRRSLVKIINRSLNQAFDMLADIATPETDQTAPEEHDP